MPGTESFATSGPRASGWREVGAGPGGGVPAWETGWCWIWEESEAKLRSVVCRRGELVSGRWDLGGFRKQ